MISCFSLHWILCTRSIDDFGILGRAGKMKLMCGNRMRCVIILIPTIANSWARHERTEWCARSIVEFHGKCLSSQW